MEAPLVTSLQQQLNKATTVNEVMEAADAELRIDRDKMYAETISCDASKMNLNPYLSEKEIEDAIWWFPYLDHEIILLHGPIRSGKGTIGDKILKLASWYYGKTVLLDYKPRPLFDLHYKPSYYDDKYNNPHDPVLVKQTEYVLFDKAVFIDQIARMGDLSLGRLANDADPELARINKQKADEVRNLTGAWVTQRGKVWFQNAIMGLDEVKQAHPRRNQLNPYGSMLIFLYDLLGHMHLSILGMTVDYDELDPNEFLNKVTVEIKVHKSEKNQYTSIGDMYRAQWVKARENRVLKKIKTLTVDGREPWPLLGNYVYAELVQDVDIGQLDLKTGLRMTPVMQFKDTTGLRDENGAGWLENEYIGWALRTDEKGFTHENGAQPQNYGIPNALIGVQRRMNWRVNHCEPARHLVGSPLFSCPGVYDIFDSENSRGLPVPKSMLK